MSVDPASWVLISVPTWLKLVHTVGANLDERPVDKIWVGSVPEFDGKPLQSVAKGEVDLDSDDEKAAHEAERQEQERDFADLLTWLKETLSDHVKEVRLSTRLIRVARLPDNRHLRHHTGARAHVPGFRTGGSGREAHSRTQPESSARHRPTTGAQEPRRRFLLVETAELLYGTALLAEGGIPEDPAKFAGLLADRLGRTVYADL